ncbi:MAG: hypothetical protein V3V31_05740 [Methylococcales bacterium]
MAIRPISLYFLLFIVLLASGCAHQSKQVLEQRSLVSAQMEIPEDQLLDVGVVVFDPGLSEEPGEQEEGNLEEIRKAESRYFATHLKNTLQNSGQWGAVRVVASTEAVTDVQITGRIVESDGEILSIAIIARDVTGRLLLDDVYEQQLEENTSYPDMGRGNREAFQNLYNAVANDLLDARQKLKVKELRSIRKTAMLTFAEDLAPDAFSGYLEEGDDSRTQIVRLPAADDPMVKRMDRMRERDGMLIDTIDGYYDNFYGEMQESYGNWRKIHREELIAKREIEAASRDRYLLGAAAILGAIALEVAGIPGTSILQSVMVVGGAVAIKSGWDKGEEAEIHSDAIKELDQSFESEVKPQVLDVEGQTVKLQGSAETQYENWRHMLRKIYDAETGFEQLEAEGGDMGDTVESLDMNE